MSVHLGIDLGGTRVKGIAMNPAGQVIAEAIGDTDASGGAESLARSVRVVVASLSAKAGLPTSAGICAPGLAAPDGSCIQWMPGRLSGLENLNWTDALDLGFAVPVLNDAQAALRGEHWLGAARDTANAIMLTLGTGVGGAILADGRILRGHIGRAGHLGHISIRPGAVRGITNLPGTLEMTLSESAFAGRFPESIESVLELVSAIETSAEARQLWGEAVHAFGRGLASLINVIDPEKIVIGGGIAQAGEALFQPLRAALDDFEWRPGGAAVSLVPAALGDRAGAFGAAREGIANSQKPFSKETLS